MSDGAKTLDVERNRAIVSDHAVLRFLERAYGLDVETVRRELADASARGRAAGAIVGAPQFVVVIDRIRLVVRSGRVVTALYGQAWWPRGSRRRR